MTEKECPHFKLDEWGVCTHRFDGLKDTCENNCLMKDNYKDLWNNFLGE
jgi:hypothetical protein